MLKKNLIGLAIIVVIGGGYFGYLKYQNYQQQEKARLIKERNKDIARMIQKQRMDNIQKEKERKERELIEAEEEVARQKRIAEGNPIIEEVINYFPNSEQKKEQYKLVEGKKEGLETIWDDKGNIKKTINYKNGKYHGEYKQYSDGFLEEQTNYIDGELDGLSIHIWGSEETHFNYKQDILHGEYIRWKRKEKIPRFKAHYKNGLLEGEAYTFIPDYYEIRRLYSKNKLLKSEAFYPTGEKLSLEEYVPEKDIIQSTFWHKNGEISFQGSKKQLNFSDYRIKFFPVGVHQHYLPTGQKFLEIPYDYQYKRNGFRLGTCYRWDENNALITEIEMDDNKPKNEAEKIIKGKVEDCELTHEEDKLVFGLINYLSNYTR